MSQFVYELIQSLSIREKAYFKRFSGIYSGSGDKNYLRLYEAIERQPHFDGEALKAAFSGESIGKHLSSELDYLVEQLLKSLLNFHMENTNYRKLLKLILFVDILMEKGFPQRALKVLRKAKKIADRNEEFSVVLKLIQQEEEILFREGILNFTEQLTQLKDERQVVTNKIQNLNELRLLREQTRELQFTDSYVTGPSKYPHIFDNPLMESEDRALSLSAKEHWFYINEIRYYLTRRFKEGQVAQRRFLSFMEEHMGFFKKSKLLSVLSNFLLVSAILGDEQTFKEGLDRLAKVEADPSLDQVYIGYIKYARLLEYHSNLNDRDIIKKLKEEAGKFLIAHHTELMGAQANYSVFLLVRACIETEDYEGAVDWLNFWNQVPSLEYTLIHRRLFTLFAYYELGWNELLLAEIDSGYKVLQSHRKYDNLAKAYFGFFRSYLRKPASKRALLAQLCERISLLKESPEDNKAFEYFDFERWCTDQLRK